MASLLCSEFSATKSGPAGVCLSTKDSLRTRHLNSHTKTSGGSVSVECTQERIAGSGHHLKTHKQQSFCLSYAYCKAEFFIVAYLHLWVLGVLRAFGFGFC